MPAATNGKLAKKRCGMNPYDIHTTPCLAKIHVAVIHNSIIVIMAVMFFLMKSINTLQRNNTSRNHITPHGGVALGLSYLMMPSNGFI